MSIIEVWRSREYVGEDETNYIATKVLAVEWVVEGDHTAIDAAETTAWSDTFTINSHKMYSRKVHIIHNSKEFPGCDLMTVTYMSDYNPAKYPYQAATMEIMSNSRRRRLRQDLSDTPKMIEGDDFTATDVLYKVVRGTNEVPVPATRVLVRSALRRSSLSWPTEIAFIGKVNNATTAHILNAAAGELMMWDVRIPQWYLYREDTGRARAEYVPVEYEFRFIVGGWDEQLKVQKYYRRAVYLPVYATEADMIAATPNYVLRDDPTSTTQNAALALKRSYIKIVPETSGFPANDRVIGAEADFSTINGWLGWVSG